MKNKARNLRKLQSLLTAVFIVGMIFTATSCKDDEGELEEIVASDPEITNIMESSGYIGDEVTINGLNFNDGASETVVKFGTVSADVTGGTITTIKTTVPTGVSFGSVDVTVTVSDLVSESESFTVLDPDDTVTVVENPIVLDDFNPKFGPHSTVITIEGENFDSEVQVYINGMLQTEVTYVDSETIAVTVSKRTGSGDVVLMRDGESDKTSAEEYVYEYTSYVVEDYSSEFGAGIEYGGNGINYISSNGGSLFQLDVNGVKEKVLIDSDDIWTVGMFLADDGILYIADFNGTILKKEAGSDVIETLIVNNDLIEYRRVHSVAGGNDGYLYVTTGFNNSVVKVNINDTSDTKELVSTGTEGAYGIICKEDSLYVTTTKGLFKMHKNGGELNYIYESDEIYETGLCITNSGEVFLSGGEIKKNAFVVNDDNTLTEIASATDLSISSTTDITCSGDSVLYLIGGAYGTKKIVRE